MEIVSMIIPWLFSLVSLIFVILTFSRNTGKDNKLEKEKLDLQMTEIKESLLKVNMKLDQVCATTNETRSDFKVMSSKIQDMDKEIDVIKRDLETAFMRIDELKMKVFG